MGERCKCPNDINNQKENILTEDSKFDIISTIKIEEHELEAISDEDNVMITPIRDNKTSDTICIVFFSLLQV